MTIRRLGWALLTKAAHTRHRPLELLAGASRSPSRSRSNFCRRDDQRIWIRSFSGSPVVGSHQDKGLFPGYGTGTVIDSMLLADWRKAGTLRQLSTKTVTDDAENRDKEAPARDKGDPTRPKSIADFQHEEIEGPTVERDLSDTAHKLRASLGEMVTVMDALKVGFIALGSMQLLAAIWSTSHHNAELVQVLSQDLGFVVSFIVAQLLRYFGSAVQFFMRTEERGRLSVLTLSLQVSKMLVLLFYRSSFVVKVVASGSAVALVIDIWLSRVSL